MDVKDILKKRRIECDLTMKQVADKVGVSEGTISRWESGEIANMRRDKIMLLASALDISPAVIMGWDIPSPAPVLSTDEQDLVDGYRQLNVSGQKQLQKQLSMMLNDDDYRKDTEFDSKEAL